jgi:hypothetical protein
VRSAGRRIGKQLPEIDWNVFRGVFKTLLDFRMAQGKRIAQVLLG